MGKILEEIIFVKDVTVNSRFHAIGEEFSDYFLLSNSIHSVFLQLPLQPVTLSFPSGCMLFIFFQ